jgi:magnesium chelatase family protein
MAIERGVRSNADLPGPRLDELAPVTADARAVLEAQLQSGNLTARGLHRIRRVARTLADLAGRCGPVEEEDVCGALMLRAEPFPSHEGLAS